jgi:tryptophan-rich sensory protein
MMVFKQRIIKPKLNKMEEYTAIIIALLLSIGFISYVVYKNKQEEEKKDTFQLMLMFLIVFTVLYMITKLILDSNDDKQVMGNIKVGEPPF